MTINEWIEKYYSPYQNAYAARLAAAQQRLDAVRDDYDYASDPLYLAYAQRFAGEGHYAALDAFGDAASGVGGMPSSYAYAAAQQAKSYYDSKLADKIPELWELAYDARLAELNSLKADEKTAYERWLDGVEAGYKLWKEENDRAVEQANLEINRSNAAVSEANAALRRAQAAAKGVGVNSGSNSGSGAKTNSTAKSGTGTGAAVSASAGVKVVKPGVSSSAKTTANNNSKLKLMRI
ncbi:MAG: hypothetical protein IJU94_00125 [Clostridia bacterium]|nr:hypothetical protein [Clostridia bacterium]